MARWGLVPFWADDPSIGNRLANARGDTVASKPSFRGAFKARRALVPADRFYEWQALPGQKVKQPWCIQLDHEAPFCFAGLWERWVPKGEPDADPLLSCCLITTEPNAVMAPIHDRMPVIVPPPAYDQWLDPGTSAAAAQALIRPYEGAMRAYPVSTYVNAPRNEGAACSAPLA
jgi:putative SOS response-associated peptidase YedK